MSAAQDSIKNEVASVLKLSEAASKYPYYKYNGMWTRHVQDAVSMIPINSRSSGAKASNCVQSFSILLCGYLGGFTDVGAGPKDGRLLTIEEVGQILNGKRDQGCPYHFNN